MYAYDQKLQRNQYLPYGTHCFSGLSMHEALINIYIYFCILLIFFIDLSHLQK